MWKTITRDWPIYLVFVVGAGLLGLFGVAVFDVASGESVFSTIPATVTKAEPTLTNGSTSLFVGHGSGFIVPYEGCRVEVNTQERGTITFVHEGSCRRVEVGETRDLRIEDYTSPFTEKVIYRFV